MARFVPKQQPFGYSASRPQEWCRHRCSQVCHYSMPIYWLAMYRHLLQQAHLSFKLAPLLLAWGCQLQTVASSAMATKAVSIFFRADSSTVDVPFLLEAAGIELGISACALLNRHTLLKHSPLRPVALGFKRDQKSKHYFTVLISPYLFLLFVIALRFIHFKNRPVLSIVWNKDYTCPLKHF